MIEMAIGSHVRVNAGKFPEKTALIQDDRKISYRELDAWTDRVARALQERGISKEDKIAICAESCIEWVVTYVGISKSGATVVPINYRLDNQDVENAVVDSQSVLIFTSQKYASKVSGASLTERDIILLDGSGEGSLDSFLSNVDSGPVTCATQAGDIQVILYTGGTTGRSKGVMLSHENVYWNSVHEIIDTEMSEDDNTILATPLHHAAALNCWLLPHLYLGATATILKSYSSEEMIRQIALHRVTNGFTPPSMARDIYLHPLVKELDISSFKRWYVGGGILGVQDRDAMHQAFPGVQIFYQYGLSEAGVIVTVLKEKDYDRAPGSIGRAFLNFEVKILREDLTDADHDEVGEIVVRGPSVMQGYYRQPEATDAVFHEGWLRTGDLGSMDQAGFVYFYDRLKDMIKSGGLNVYCQEVEQTLLKHEAIREAAVIGMPSQKWGEEVTAVVVLHDDMEASGPEIIAFSRNMLPGFKTPKRVIFLPYEDLPINYSGKILKRELRVQLSSGISESLSPS